MSAFAQLAVERILNSLPEGLLLAFSAWLLLRIMGRQNSGTRFAVWMVVLCGVVALPLLGGLGGAQPILSLHPHAQITIPAFWAAVFFVLWIAVACLALARVAVGIAQVRRIRRDCTEVPVANLDPMLQATMRPATLRKIGRPVRLLVSERVRVPAAIGFRKPAIVLPAWTLSELTPAQLNPILIHELAHLRRHDDWTNLLQKAIRAILFFHPAVWWIDGRLSMEREMACDDAVLVATGNPKAYAGCLIGLLERSCARRQWTMAQAAVARAREASVRIARILHVGAPATTRIARPALGIAAALSLACSGVLLCAPRLLVFAPASATVASIPALAPPLEDSVHIPPAAVIQAAYHPETAHARLHKAVLTMRDAAASSAPIRHVVAHRVHRTAPPVVLASLVAPVRVTAETSAPGSTLQEASAPAMLMFETAEFTAVQPISPQRTSPRPTMATAQHLQGREVPIMQIQTLQMIEEDATGVHMQILRIVFVLPQAQEETAQSI